MKMNLESNSPSALICVPILPVSFECGAVENAIKQVNLHRKLSKPELRYYLEIGCYLSSLATDHPSTKERHAKMMRDFPNLKGIGSTLRSNCKRLYEAVHGFRDHDLLEVLGVQDIDDYYTANPTVIIRDYRERKASHARH
ncbi:hypothetical protein ATO6_02830 [Oceanicola sp. 22II-s10i]|uniref:hypothetical protein n=1 Tax=Oceanicola sp. 22II-s10i TaxID=1317116 RepID=UPI000B521C19|nr:hypothetical protein [Oceanicola sp. 22II-s10i]OWU85849.1 hypothetical protein ATO6_02830 [Oceanicola sp. 22II-s10i]